ncbi:phage tail tube protein [Parasporobacterium paucivorans]|uniref:Phage major tail protein, TP901-1 family n=1 Tax=Parasporobacterium paucivorans DSM 15970 TaxID=1122934 RepID=A0A1M6B1X5_9FIRM|nr:hypothetical protein [Parasporobacterium paucivorans]SHI42677.1 hypothetical protein SAMN02745691_00237 [Parasporobacterium paucivorans DSM 15970]
MVLSTLMTGITPDAAFEGWVTNDDYVFAIDLAPDAVTPTAVTAYGVVQMGVEGLDAQMNPVTVEKQFIRDGKSTLKTGSQRSFKLTGDRYIGDDAQDFLIGTVGATGQAAITNYVYFNILTGKGEKGQITIIVNSDSAGKSGESSSIDIELKKVGAEPVAYTYAAA